MNVLLPITTIILIALGAFCVFIAMDNNRRSILKRTDHIDNNKQVYSSIISTENIES